MSSTAVLPSRRWTCDRCFVTKEEPGDYRPADWVRGEIGRYGAEDTCGDYCPSCTAVLEKAFKPLVIGPAADLEPYPGATETTMGGR